MTKTAVVLVNLGGPDRTESIRPFLFNLFYDPAIVRLPNPLRFFLAWWIAKRRVPYATKNYAKIEGKSPLLENTQAQANALEKALKGRAKVFIAMRYWHPLSLETAYQVKEYAPDKVVILPLYPQWSTTTTASSWKMWKVAARAAGLKAPTTLVCCYPTEEGFIQTSVENIAKAYTEARKHGGPRLLFSAHGLPESVVKGGDPYAWQCEQTAQAIVQKMGIPGLDWALCYQSRVGRLKWIGPSTSSEIERAGRDQVPVVVYPLSFVSEHVETLVEINQEYRARAQANGVPFFALAPTAGISPAFIDGLARSVEKAVLATTEIVPPSGKRLCPREFCGCFLGSF